MLTGKCVAVTVCLLAPGLFAAGAAAQQAPDALDVCYQVKDSAARVACYDQEVQRRHAAVSAQPQPPVVMPSTPSAIAPVSPAPAPVAAPRVVSSPGVDDTIGLDGKQLDIRRRQEGIQPVAIKPFVASLSRLQPRPGHQYTFELDNGQVWESTDSEPDLFLNPHEAVTIRPGILGAFFLKTQEGNSIRVHRLR